ncbi:MAG: hypothetical protein IM545_07110, partial [Chitinophagaceae bacterium]|nr:hypothetical protein [Chitinophagaceae bacterium]
SSHEVAEDGKTRKILAAAAAEETTDPAEAEATRVVNVVTATTEEISTTAIKLPALTGLLIMVPLSFPKN